MKLAGIILTAAGILFAALLIVMLRWMRKNPGIVNVTGNPPHGKITVMVMLGFPSLVLLISGVCCLLKAMK